MWSILLIAIASQCIFLIIAMLFKKTENKRTAAVLIVLLSIIFCISISNIWSATYLYRTAPGLSNFARGMVLLLGPALYLYTQAALRAGFTFRPGHLYHLLPYMVAFIIIRLQEGSVSLQITIASIDALMEGKVNMDWVSTLWFVAYFIHLLIYTAAARRQMKASLKSKDYNYLMSLNQRVKWLKNLSLIFIIIALVFVGITGYIMITGLYTITGNFIYTTVLAALVYSIAFQAMANTGVLLPGFGSKYASIKVNDSQQDIILSRLRNLFENEKIFTDPGLKMAAVAKKVEASPHIVSQVINEKLNKTFSELVNYYRTEEFKVRIQKQEYVNYSIMGIASQVGYNSKSSFNVAFKKQNGITPSEYLRSIT